MINYIYAWVDSLSISQFLLVQHASSANVRYLLKKMIERYHTAI